MAVAPLRPPRTVFECTACGDVAPKWQGRCGSCGAWNTLTEALAPQIKAATRAAVRDVGVVQLNAADRSVPRRRSLGISEVDRVLGGGVVAGSVVLLGGDPGVGKSTLAMQLASAPTGSGGSLYCSGEESEDQLALRAVRTRCAEAPMQLLIENDLESVAAAIERLRPPLAVVDSVQTLLDRTTPGTAGSPSQVRAAVGRLGHAAKSTGVAIVLIGHVTKDGAIAGPRTLEHMVDVVLYLEGDRLGERRMLRGIKNRFGSTGELGLLAMGASGMRALGAAERASLDVTSLQVSGNVLTITCEGVRALPVEVQALTVKATSPVPRRTCSGFDFNRLCLLLAVLEKRCSLGFGAMDVFFNAAGGVHLNDPAVDLAVALALAGSLRNRALQPGWAAIGELGLGGEVRPVARADARAAEAAAAGARELIVPAGTRVDVGRTVTLHPVASVREALRHLG
ncbi:MAG: DNA repair protein RadA [Candidatus Dormibacteria bacterium]